MAFNTPHNTDEELVASYQNTHDKNVVGELFKRHSLMCFTVCHKYLKNEDAAKDAGMAVFEKLFTDLLKHTPQNFKSWLYSVCKNHCLMQLRKPVMEVLIEGQQEENEDFFVQFDAILHQQDAGNDKEYKLQALESAMELLNDKQRVCVDLFYLQQKSYDEVSQQTGYTTNEVKSYIQNGKRNLKNTLSQKGILFGWVLLLWIQHTA
jgi:RNA polymerase sigma factor (sigma-70 family)